MCMQYKTRRKLFLLLCFEVMFQAATKLLSISRGEKPRFVRNHSGPSFAIIQNKMVISIAADKPHLLLEGKDDGIV